MESENLMTATIKSAGKTFLTPDFLLYNKFAIELYHDFAAGLPIIDFHNHLPPAEIAANKQFNNLTEIWLKGDHYKWRAMRVLGIDEKYITGNASDEEKFLKWGAAMPQTIMNPLFHWSQMELLHPFGVADYLKADNASSIYDHCNSLLQRENFSTCGILKQFNVEVVGTTDDPIDDLAAHAAIANSNAEVKVYPSFRPDKIFNITNADQFFDYLQKLETCTGIEIKSTRDLLTALQTRVDFFHKHGCRVSDHGLSAMPAHFKWSTQLDKEFEIFIADRSETFSAPEAFAGFILLELCKMYHKNNWVQQFHLGAIRNNNARMLQKAGPDTGYDSIGDYTQGETLSAFLNELDSSDQLAKTILYNLNPADNEMFAAMSGNFNSGTIKGKVQYGPAWWFLDQKDGMEKQLKTLANLSLLSSFVGMTTDSRSFLSYSRHEYFRRILCGILGAGMEAGELPADTKWIGEIVQDICYNNAREYFGFHK